MMTNPTGRITQGQFSFLPDLTDAEITMQIEYGLKKGYAWSIEYTDDPHPRNTYWDMYGHPNFDLEDAAAMMMELKGCRQAFPQHYIRMLAFDSTRGVETVVMSFIVNHKGTVYQKDLGANTKQAAAGIKTFDPDPSWSAVAE